MTGAESLRPGSEYYLFCRFFCRIFPLKCWPRCSVTFYIRAIDSQFTSTDLAVFDHLSQFKTTARRPIQVTNDRGRVPSQSALEFCPIHCPNGCLGQDLGFGGFAFALKLPELLNRNLAAVRAKLEQTSCFPNGPQIWCPIEQ